MDVLNFILNLILFLVSLGVLITIHELGHLMTAKLFNVYCMEFSIGFGPKLFKYKKPGRETTYSLGLIPLGGYVMMYGEGAVLPQGVEIGPERSLEGIKKWKKAIVLSAGIILNMVLGMVLFLISNTLPFYQFDGQTLVSENSLASESGLLSNYQMGYVKYLEGDSGTTLIVDSEVIIKENTYVLGFVPNKVKNTPKFEDGLTFYEAKVLPDQLDENNAYHKLILEGKLKNLPNMAKGHVVNNLEDPLFLIGDKIDISLRARKDRSEGSEISVHDLTLEVYSPGLNKPLAFKETGLGFTFLKSHRTFKEVVKDTWGDFAYANTAIVKGLGSLFAGKGEVSGVVGIFSTSSTILADYGFATYIFLWGLISVNLAIFNLLPFPGLDGWQLLVTLIEGVSRKKVPDKVKNIISTIGLILLFGLMILITIKDIIGLF
ncbi:MAG: site-2 protease family protein [Bacilli bacterium]|jgi:regulator of sigma E protease|nr:site-2 protease family protein [Bacilli bacterium]